MQNIKYSSTLLSDISLRAGTTALALAFTLTLLITTAAAQSYNVIYNFQGDNDGANPLPGVTFDRAGDLYGTTSAGGVINCGDNNLDGCGSVFKLTHARGGWTFATLHVFLGSPDGGNPSARVVAGPNGALFGTTTYGGTVGLGTVFELQPPVNICPTPSCHWGETQLHSFFGQFSAA